MACELGSLVYANIVAVEERHTIIRPALYFLTKDSRASTLPTSKNHIIWLRGKSRAKLFRLQARWFFVVESICH